MIPGATNPLMWGQSDPLDELARIDRSLRLRLPAAPTIRRNAVAGNRQTLVFGVWLRDTVVNAIEALYCGVVSAGSSEHQFRRDATGQFTFMDGSTSTAYLQTAGSYRDPAGWRQVIFAIDTTQAVQANRGFIIVNGVAVPLSASALPLNFNTAWHVAANGMGLGCFNSIAGSQCQSLMAQAFVIDGYPTGINQGNWSAANIAALFGQQHPLTRQWRPKSDGAIKAIVDAGGPNSGLWTFKDTSSLSALVSDTSVKGNNWTATNISLAAGTTYDSFVDTPTTNYCVLNSLLGWSSAPALSDANLTYLGGVSSFPSVLGTIGMTTGAWWWEVRCNTANITVSVAKASANINSYIGTDANGWSYTSTGFKLNNNVSTAYGATFGASDVVGVLFDADAGTLTFYKQTGGVGAFVSQGVAFTGLTNGPYFPASGDGASGTQEGATFNFGQRPFNNSNIPGGAKALCAKNLPKPGGAVLKPWEHFDIDLFTGDGIAKNRGGFAFKPDNIWMKSRNAARSHRMFSSLRGVGNRLEPNLANAEIFDAQTLTAFNSDGYSVGTSAEVNAAGETIVAWLLRAGGAPVTNNNGTISAQVSANTLAGISLVKCVGNGVAGATVGHGLPKAPALVIGKCTTVGGTSWRVWHQNLPATNNLFFDSVGISSPVDRIGDTFNSTVFSIAPTTPSSGMNANGATYEFICFAEVPGFSKFGLYTGNSLADGTFVDCGFLPYYIMAKDLAGASFWFEWDTARETYNTMGKILSANTTSSESAGTAYNLDAVSNGFKFRWGGGDPNQSGRNFAFWAFAKSTFRYSNSR